MFIVHCIVCARWSSRRSIWSSIVRSWTGAARRIVAAAETVRIWATTCWPNCSKESPCNCLQFGRRWATGSPRWPRSRNVITTTLARTWPESTADLRFPNCACCRSFCTCRSWATLISTNCTVPMTIWPIVSTVGPSRTIIWGGPTGSWPATGSSRPTNWSTCNRASNNPSGSCSDTAFLPPPGTAPSWLPFSAFPISQFYLFLLFNKW